MIGEYQTHVSGEYKTHASGEFQTRVQTKFKNVSDHAAHAPILSHYTSADVWNLRNHQKWPQTAEVKGYISLLKYRMEREFGPLLCSIGSF